MVVLIKMILIIIGICYKLCRREMRPENEYLRNLLKPRFIPSLCKTEQQQKQHHRKPTRALLHRLESVDDSTPQSRRNRRLDKSETIDMGGAKSYYVYYRMEDQRKNRNICCKFLYCLYYGCVYIWLFCLWLYQLIRWVFITAFWLIVLILNWLMSVQLFFIHHSPVLGTDVMDFCSNDDKNSNNLTKAACNIGQNTCGIVNWVILPDVQKYVVPRYITLIVAC